MRRKLRACVRLPPVQREERGVLAEDTHHAALSVPPSNTTMRRRTSSGPTWWIASIAPWVSSGQSAKLRFAAFTISCTAEATAVVAVNTLIVGAAITQNIGCFGNSTGVVTVSVGGGQPPDRAMDRRGHRLDRARDEDLRLRARHQHLGTDRILVIEENLRSGQMLKQRAFRARLRELEHPLPGSFREPIINSGIQLHPRQLLAGLRAIRRDHEPFNLGIDGPSLVHG